MCAAARVSGVWGEDVARTGSLFGENESAVAGEEPKMTDRKIGRALCAVMKGINRIIASVCRLYARDGRAGGFFLLSDCLGRMVSGFAILTNRLFPY